MESTIAIEVPPPTPPCSPANDAGVEALVAAAAPDAPPAPRTLSVDLAVAGGVTLDLARPAAQATAVADVSLYERWAATLEAGFESNRSVTGASGGGTLDLQSYWVGLAGRVRLVSHLHAALGARLFFMSAQASGPTSDSRLVLGGAVFTALDWRQPLGESLFLLARVGGQARFRAESVSIPGSDTALYLPPWSFFALGGLGLKL